MIYCLNFSTQSQDAVLLRLHFRILLPFLLLSRASQSWLHKSASFGSASSGSDIADKCYSADEKACSCEKSITEL